MPTTIWRFNRITGFWRIERCCTPETVAIWLALFERDEPSENFAVSRFAPKHNPTKAS